jgi:nitrous oxide reductase
MDEKNPAFDEPLVDNTRRQFLKSAVLSGLASGASLAGVVALNEAHAAPPEGWPSCSPAG